MRISNLVVIALMVSLSACDRKEPFPPSTPPNVVAGITYEPINNERIIELTKQCEDAGLTSTPLFVKEQFGDLAVDVQCRPILKCTSGEK